MESPEISELFSWSENRSHTLKIKLRPPQIFFYSSLIFYVRCNFMQFCQEIAYAFFLQFLFSLPSFIVCSERRPVVTVLLTFEPVLRQLIRSQLFPLLQLPLAQPCRLSARQARPRCITPTRPPHHLSQPLMRPVLALGYTRLISNSQCFSISSRVRLLRCISELVSRMEALNRPPVIVNPKMEVVIILINVSISTFELITPSHASQADNAPLPLVSLIRSDH